MILILEKIYFLPQPRTKTDEKSHKSGLICGILEVLLWISILKHADCGILINCGFNIFILFIK